MVESHLSPRTLKVRRLGAFFALGALLYGLKLAVSQPEAPRTLVVTVDASATQAEVERAIDEAVLLDQALARGGALIDPIVREQLLRSMRVATPQPEDDDEATLLDRAMALGVHRADPLIRARLAFQAEQFLRASARVDPPTEAQLEAYRSAHQERYREAARFSFAHVFISRSRHGAALEAESAARGAQLREADPPSGEAFRYSDPSILPRTLTRATERETAARFGATFAKEVVAAPLEVWHGPVPSSYGQHYVRVTAREGERLPPLNELRNRLTTDFVHDAKQAAAARRVRELRAHYNIEVERSKG